MTHIELEESLQPVEWEPIDDACYDWLNDVLGMADNIIWEQRNTPQPGYPYLSLLRNPETDEGGLDERRDRTIADDGSIMEQGSPKTPVENEELIYQPIRWTLTVTAHVSFKEGSTDPACDAMALLGKAKRSLGLTATVDRLRVVGISIIEPIGPTNTSVVVNGEWVSKATLDVAFRTASVITGRHEFIDKVELKSDALNVDVTVDAS